MAKYSRRQYLIIIVISLAQFCSSVCFSLQAPFYPSEANKKGVTATQYGFVFGICQLISFCSSLLFGYFTEKLGMKFMICTGTFVVSVTSILFGSLVKVEGALMFIIMSFVVRAFETIAASAASISSFSLIGREFSDNVASTFALIETFFGVGRIVGPSVGGVLYEIGGFFLPFAAVGVLLVITGIFLVIIIPSYTSSTEQKDLQGICFLLSKAPFALGSSAIIACSCGLGFVQATLEPHIRRLNLTPLQVGLLFICHGGTYAVCGPLCGRLCDKRISPHIIILIGTFFNIASFSLIGPAPYFPFDTKVSTVVVALIFQGFGSSGILVGSFSWFQKSALKVGLPDGVSTSSLISGNWKSAFALGCFVGPSIGGILFDRIGFSWTTQIIVGFHSIVLLSMILYICSDKCKKVRAAFDAHNNLITTSMSTEIPKTKYESI